MRMVLDKIQHPPKKIQRLCPDNWEDMVPSQYSSHAMYCICMWRICFMQLTKYGIHIAAL